MTERHYAHLGDDPVRETVETYADKLIGDGSNALIDRPIALERQRGVIGTYHKRQQEILADAFRIHSSRPMQLDLFPRPRGLHAFLGGAPHTGDRKMNYVSSIFRRHSGSLYSIPARFVIHMKLGSLCIVPCESNRIITIGSNWLLW